MGESLDKLEQTDSELKEYIRTLQGTADELRKSITENDSKIASLEEALDQAIRDAQNSDSALRGDLERQIESAKIDVLAQLASARASMESRLEQIESTIATLQSKDGELETKISELRTYIDKGISDTKDWASATFATLEQYNSIVSDISGIRKSTEALELSMKTLEESFDGKIKQSVDDAVAGLKDQLVSETAAAVVAGYTESISSVKAELAELASRVKKLEEDVRLIKEDIDNIKKELEEIDDKIDGQQPLSKIQSIVFVPYYSDGTVAMCYRSEDDGTIVPGEAKMQFEVLPAEMADVLAQSWKSTLNLKTDVGESAVLPIKNVSSNNGVLTITASGVNMNEAFFKKEMSARVRLTVNINGAMKSSDYVLMVASITNGIYIKDAEFKRYLVDKFDSNDDKEISLAEALSVKSINVNGVGTVYKRISSLEGLEYFTNLVSLDCSNLWLKEVNVSKNVGLKYLYASGLYISELDLSSITQLRSLDVTNNVNLHRLICASQNWLDNVNVFSNSMLSYVDTLGNELIGSVLLGKLGPFLTDGMKWLSQNVGSTAENPYGDRYTFEEAQSACPAGWRTPTESELEFLSANYSEETTVNGIKGRLFSGNKVYTDTTPAIFLPYVCDYDFGFYWSSTAAHSANEAYVLQISSKVMVYSDRQFSCCAVRCVKS